MSSPTSKQRRAFTVSSQGEIETGGRASVAEWLGRALDAPAQALAAEAPPGLTHGFHTYPARLHPGTVGAIIDCFEPERIFDPFCGSGTVLVEGLSRGCFVVGGDINPLAVRIARAKTWDGSRSELKALQALAESIADDAILAGKKSRQSGAKPAPHRQRVGNEKLMGWFPPHVRRELEYLADRVDDKDNVSPAFAEILWMALSSILYKVSFRASDTDNSKVERQIARGQPARLFRDRVFQLTSGLEKIRDKRLEGRPRIFEGDARKMTGIGDESFDAVITSPPYGGTYDYASHHEMRLLFLGINPKSLALGEIGARRQFQDTYPGAFPRWANDLGTCMEEMTRATKPGGHVVIVMGDSLAGGKRIASDELVMHLAGEKLELDAWARQTRPVFSSAEKQAFEGVKKYEHILAFRRL